MKFIIQLLPAALVICLCSCKKNTLLDQYPETKIASQNFWNTDQDFRTYALGLYNFYGYGVDRDWTSIPYNSDESARGGMIEDARIFDQRTIPTTGGGWIWSYLRSVNIMIREARSSKLPAADKLHWEAVGRFFRANEYFRKVIHFGDVPWIGSELNVNSPELTAAQDPRSLVMDSVLADLNFAVANLRTTDQANQIVKDVALALKSRICLFEGTYRKYHTELGLTDADNWFRECVSASTALMSNSKYHLNADYRSIYSSLNLAGNPEIFLYKEYEPGVIVNIRTASIIVGSETTGAQGVDATKDAAESYLCSDGLPYGVSPTHPKAVLGLPETIDEEFMDRDPRMSMTFVIPYDGTPKQDPPEVDRPTGKIPPFMPIYKGEGTLSSATGYHPYKWWNPDSPFDDVNGITDAPLFAFNEVLLNYAEAEAELGECTDDVLNQSINKLRDRVGMPHLTVALAAAINDPKRQTYAPEISSLLWEIRRERQVELMMDGSASDNMCRLYDVLRWKKASYFSKPFLGAWVDLKARPAAAYNTDGTPKASIVLGDRNGNVLQGATQGYVLPYGSARQPQYSDNDLKLYYDPIPTQELVLDPQLHQSPGW